MKNVVIYSTSTCPYCVLAKNYFDQNNIKYTEKDVSTNKEAAQEMVEKSSQNGVPVITIDDQVIVGFDKEAVDKALGI